MIGAPMAKEWAFLSAMRATIGDSSRKKMALHPITTLSDGDVSVPGKLSRTVYLETFGCQMNELDSELVRGQLQALGYSFTDHLKGADVVLYNTCSVREKAEQKVWSRVGLHSVRRRNGAKTILGIIGCMAEREGPDLMRRFPAIDLMCGPGELDKLPLLIDNAFRTEAVDRAERIALQGNTARRSATLSAATDNLEMLDLSRAFDPDRSTAGARSAYVRITRGCNKFCTYCVVPYTRGAEVHRPPGSIVDECKRLADAGVIEVTLLGQTVNHYIYTHGAAVSVSGLELPQVGPGAAAFAREGVKQGVPRLDPTGQAVGAARVGLSAQPVVPVKHQSSIVDRQFIRTTTFADLLQRIHDEVPAIRRLRFLTSFPRDFGDDILAVMAACPRLCRYLHVPAQSGSNRLLKLMNRGYSVEEYLEFIQRARTFLPDVCIAGDFIVGFPTETDDDFEQSKQLIRAARYKNSFIFKYSPRPGTVAIDRFANDVPEHVKRARNNALLAVQAEVSAQEHEKYIGRTVDVFVERVERAEVRSQRSEVRGPGGQRSGTALTINGQHSERDKSSIVNRQSSIALTGRTDGDLIVSAAVAGDVEPAQLVGQIVPVKIESAVPLLLRGRGPFWPVEGPFAAVVENVQASVAGCRA
jgi:tRNA-2-methylthio-N6-dimethylallyladenosine synthase